MVNGRELAGRLAHEAERLAETLDRLAAVHESFAGQAGHPLHDKAISRASEERRLARVERRSAEWLRSLEAGREPAGRLPRLTPGAP